MSETLRLFCLPYAGGSSRVFRDWGRSLPGFVDVVPLELPGRGSRFGDPLVDRLDPLLDDLLRTVLPRLDAPYAFFGHSLGAMLGYELARRLEREHPPQAMFVSAARAPHVPVETQITYDLPDEEFRRRLGDLEGTPREIVENDELMDLFLPVLRADFTVADTYVHEDRPPLACPLTAFGGLEDGEVSLNALHAWRRYTTGAFSVRILPGNHFFVDTARDALLHKLGEELTAHRPAAA